MASLEGTKTDRQALTGNIAVKHGVDGESVTITDITESTEDGGTNTVKFSDGSMLNIKNGSSGKNGKDGKDGKTAYQYAQDGGYTGTEEEFAVLMAQENLQTEKVSKLSEDIATKASAIKETASGETIVATDSDDEKPLGLAIDGKSEQTQYSGKNLLKNLRMDYTVVNNGVTFIRNKDESITVNGTATETAYYNFDFSNENRADVSITETDVIATTGVNVTNLYMGVGYFDSDNNATNLHNVFAEEKFKYPSNAVTTRTFICVSKGATINNTTVYPMIRLASIDDDTYEPFVGGIPSPNPSYHQEIRNIGVYDEASGKYAVEVKCTGKNIMSSKLGRYEYDNDTGKRFDFSDKNTHVSTSDLFIIQSGKKLTLSHNHIFSDSTGITKIMEYDKNNVFICRNVSSSKNNIITFTPSAECRYIAIVIYDASGVSLDGLEIQVEVGTVATGYESYKETTATVLLDEPLRKGDKAYWNGGSKIRVDRYRDIEVFDGSDDEGWNAEQAGNAHYYRNVTDLLTGVVKKSINNDEVFTGVCDSYIQSTPSKTYAGNEGVCINTRGSFYVYDKNFNTSDVSLWKAHLAKNPITVEYELATPITEEIDIDLGELSMFYPTTVISNDCNANMEVEYIADTKAYIDKKFAELATAMV